MNMVNVATVFGEDLSSWVNSITGALGDISVENLITIILAALGITVPFLVFWFAYRFITRKASKAIKKGGL